MRLCGGQAAGDCTSNERVHSMSTDARFCWFQLREFCTLLAIQIGTKNVAHVVDENGSRNMIGRYRRGNNAPGP